MRKTLILLVLCSGCITGIKVPTTPIVNKIDTQEMAVIVQLSLDVAKLKYSVFEMQKSDFVAAYGEEEFLKQEKLLKDLVDTRSKDLEKLYTQIGGSNG